MSKYCIPVVRALIMPARRPLKSFNASSTVRGLYCAPPSIPYRYSVLYNHSFLFSLSFNSGILKDFLSTKGIQGGVTSKRIDQGYFRNSTWLVGVIFGPSLNKRLKMNESGNGKRGSWLTSQFFF